MTCHINKSCRLSYHYKHEWCGFLTCSERKGSVRRRVVATKCKRTTLLLGLLWRSATWSPNTKLLHPNITGNSFLATIYFTSDNYNDVNRCFNHLISDKPQHFWKEMTILPAHELDEVPCLAWSTVIISPQTRLTMWLYFKPSSHCPIFFIVIRIFKSAEQSNSRPKKGLTF